MKACLNPSQSSFPATSRRGRSLSYRRWQADGADSGSTACGGSGRAASPGALEALEEERRPLPSSLERGVEQEPWRRRTRSHL